jgi:hypothetical protein
MQDNGAHRKQNKDTERNDTFVLRGAEKLASAEDTESLADDAPFGGPATPWGRGEQVADQRGHTPLHASTERA